MVPVVEHRLVVVVEVVVVVDSIEVVVVVDNTEVVADSTVAVVEDILYWYYSMYLEMEEGHLDVDTI